MSRPRGSSRAGAGCRSAECCLTLEDIMSLNERSFSVLRGAVLIGLCWAYIRSGSTYFVLGEDSRGLCSSPRIDLVLVSRLKGFGLFFLAKFAEAEAEAYARGWSAGRGAVAGASVLGGAPTGLRVVDLSRPGSAVQSI